MIRSPLVVLIAIVNAQKPQQTLCAFLMEDKSLDWLQTCAQGGFDWSPIAMSNDKDDGHVCYDHLHAYGCFTEVKGPWWEGDLEETQNEDASSARQTLS